jgi:hypothetical protein
MIGKIAYRYSLGAYIVCESLFTHVSTATHTVIATLPTGHPSLDYFGQPRRYEAVRVQRQRHDCNGYRYSVADRL